MRRSDCQRRRLSSRRAKHSAADGGRGSEPLAAKQPIATRRRGIFDKGVNDMKKHAPRTRSPTCSPIGRPAPWKVKSTTWVASSPDHLLAWRLLVTYCGSELPDAGLPGSKLSETAIQAVCDYIEENLCTQITLEALAALVYLSPFHFARCFKATIGLAPHQYVIARRMELAKRLVLTTTLNVAEIAWSVGYENISHFRRLFTMHIGMTPGEIRRAAGVQPRP